MKNKVKNLFNPDWFIDVYMKMKRRQWSRYHEHMRDVLMS